MQFERLRQLLIQKAIEGKLVPQLAEEPAVEQIGEAPEEVSFEIPAKWKWIRFKYTCNSLDGKRIPLKKDVRAKLDKRYPYYGATGVIDFVDNFIFDGNFLLIGEDGANLLSRSKENAFVVSGKIWVNNHAHIFEANGVAYLKYLSIVINGMSLQPYVTGSAQPKLTQKNLYSILIPLPPLAEQRRIVARLNELLSVIKKAEDAYEDLQMLGESLRAKMIQKAIEGKLVPQLAEEPAVEQIGEAPEEVPFEIPTKWRWVNIGEISEVVRGGSPRPIKQYLTDSPDGINWIKIGDATRGTRTISRCAEKIIPEGIKRSRFVKKGALLLTNSMSYGYPYVLDVDGCIHDGWLALSDFEKVADRDFLYFFLMSSTARFQFDKIAAGAVVKNLNVKKVKFVKIPIPPLAEQRRIVAKLNELLPLVDKMVA